MRSLSIALLLFVLTVPAPAQQAPAERVLPEYQQPGVVLLALGSTNSTDALTKILLETMHRPLAKMQAEIAMKAARKNPVVILAPDDEAKLRFLQHCDDFEGLCAALDDGRVRIHVVPHRTEWIRDYGPMFRTTVGGPVLLDASYHDVRNDIDKREVLDTINRQRLSILQSIEGETLESLIRDAGDEHVSEGQTSEDEPMEETEEAGEAEQFDGTHEAEEEEQFDPAQQVEEAGEQQGGSYEHGSDADVQADPVPEEPSIASEEEESFESEESEDEELTPEELQQLLSILGLAEDVRRDTEEAKKTADAQLFRLRELYDALEKYGDERVLDDESPGPIVLSLFSKPNIQMARPKIDLDGGNILPMPDGRCITTRGLLARNMNQGKDAQDVLEKEYGCKDVIFLEALPGGVIEHVDMFVLPSGDDRLFVASYDPSEPVLKKYWPDLSPSMKRIVLEAAVAMANNARLLRQKGYKVTDVPSPLPQAGSDRIWYPTILNGLVHIGDDQKRQFLLPRYDDYQNDVQDAAFALIRKTLGAEAEVDTIESTRAAMGQGAVHCLTTVIPRQWTHDGDAAAVAIRDRMQKEVLALDRSLTAGRVGALEGTWHIEDGDWELVGDERTVVFRHQRVRYKVGDLTQGSMKYEVVDKSSNRWQLKLDNGAVMQIAWNDPNSIDLIGADDEKKYTLTRK